MSRPKAVGTDTDVDAVTDAVLTASRLLVAISARSITAVDDTITLPQFRLLVVLHTNGPLKHAVLAERLGVSPSTASRMVDRLAGAGMVRRQTSETSRREVTLRLTSEGGQVVRQVTSRRRREITKIVTQLPEPERAGLIAALTSFAQAGGEPPASVAPDAAWP
jgi:DNA-binding MarR family transcriptional regulator